MSWTTRSAAVLRTAMAGRHQREPQDDSGATTPEPVAVEEARDFRSSRCRDETVSCCQTVTGPSRLNCSKTARCRPHVDDSFSLSPVPMTSANEHEIDNDSGDHFDVELRRVTLDPQVAAPRSRCQSPIGDVSDVWSSSRHFDRRIVGDVGDSVAGGSVNRMSLVACSSPPTVFDATTTNWRNKRADLIEDVTASFEQSSPIVRRKRANSLSGCNDVADVADDVLRSKRPMRHLPRSSTSIPSLQRRHRVDAVNFHEPHRMALTESETETAYRCLCSTSGLPSDVIISECDATEFDLSDRRAPISIHAPTAIAGERITHDDTHSAARNDNPKTISTSGYGSHSTASTSAISVDCRRRNREDDRSDDSSRHRCRDHPIGDTSSVLDVGPQPVQGVHRRPRDKSTAKFYSWLTAAVMVQCVSLLVGPAHCSARHLQSSPLLPPSSSVSSLSSSFSPSSPSSSSSSLGLSSTAGQQRQVMSRTQSDSGSLTSPDVAIGVHGPVLVGGGGGGTVSGGRSPRSDSGSSMMMGDGPGLPCIYEGHIKSDRDWYGYIANISVRTTGQLGFEFVYPADRCCQNVLFYLDEQAAIIGPRMNCWQREYLLRPEDDQILRLTPSFSWSGCHVVASADERVGDVFVCKGGRSFSVDVGDGGRMTTWQIAVSNCATLNGIELRYRLEVFGHVGECTGRRPEVQPTSLISARYNNAAGNVPDNEDTEKSSAVLASGSGSRSSLTPREAATHHRGSKSATDDEERVCIVVGDVNTTYSWFGFLRNLSLEAGGGYRFMFTYPPSMQVQSVLLYNEEDVHKLDWEQTCWQKEGVIASEKIFEQIIEMQVESTLSGCSVNETATGPGSYRLPLPAPTHGGDEGADHDEAVEQPVNDGSSSGHSEAGTTAYPSTTANLTCLGEKRYDAPTKVYLALSNCRSNGRGLRLRYRLEVFGYAKDDLCARSSSSSLIYDITPSISSIFDLLVADRYDVGQTSPGRVFVDGSISRQRTFRLVRYEIRRRVWRSLGFAVVAIAVAAGSIQLL